MPALRGDCQGGVSEVVAHFDLPGVVSGARAAQPLGGRVKSTRNGAPTIRAANEVEAVAFTMARRTSSGHQSGVPFPVGSREN